MDVGIKKLIMNKISQMPILFMCGPLLPECGAYSTSASAVHLVPSETEKR